MRVHIQTKQCSCSQVHIYHKVEHPKKQKTEQCEVAGMLLDARSNNCQIVELLLDQLIMYHFHILKYIYSTSKDVYCLFFCNLCQMVVLDIDVTTDCGNIDSLSIK